MKIKNIIKRFFAIIIIGTLTTFTTVYGQKPNVHWCKDEFTIWGGGGWSALYYRPAVGIRNNHLGGLFGFGYTRNFSSHWGMLLGIEAALYQSSLSISNLADNYNTTDLDPYEPAKFNFRYRIDKYEEKQHLWNVNIPVALQFQTPVWDIHKFYMSLGFKLGIPVSARAESTAANIETYGYYPEWDQVLNEPKVLGFGKFENHTTTNKLEIGLAYIGTIETGLKWRIGNGVHLYTGVYFDYAFNDVSKNHSNHFVDYNSYHDGSFSNISSALNSQYTTNDNSIGIGFGEYYEHNGNVKSLVDKVSPITVGIKLRFSFGCPDKSAKANKKKDDKCCPDTRRVEAEFANFLDKLDTLTEAVKKQKQTDTIIVSPKPATTVHQQQMQQQQPQDELSSPYSIQQELDARRNNDIEEAGIINYDLNISQLNEFQKLIMDRYVRMMKSHPDYNLLITGHTCDLGSNASNFLLGLKRADLAKAYLIEQGINPNRISTFTAGEEDPIVVNNSNINRKRNRRLEFGVVLK
jgi:outer membrane protein OmpA-like peptidoglycan-associated protein